MSERFARLHTLPSDLYLQDAPILIAAGALLKDIPSNQVLVQLKLQNLNKEILSACKISIKTFDPSGAELPGVESYSYLDLAVPRGNDFGSKNPIYLPDNTTRNISVSVIQAVFADGRVWEHPFDDWKEILPKQQKISEEFSDLELQKQYFLETDENCEYVPTVSGNLFLCTCGAVNLAKDETCAKCGRDVKSLLSALDLTELTRKKDERLAQEEAERLEQERKAAEEQLALERKAEEERLARERRAEQFKRKLKRAAIIISIMIIIALSTGAVVKYIIIPGMHYKAAENLLESGAYVEAISAFEAMGDYKDCPEKILECKYAQAEHYLQTGDFENALSIFTELKDYGDSSNRFIEAQEGIYQQALHFESSNDFLAAQLAYGKIIGYKDTGDKLEQLQEKAYHSGIEKMQSSEYQDALDCFSVAGDDYLDAAEYKRYCEIMTIDFNDGRLHDAPSIIAAINTISDSNMREELKAIPQIRMIYQFEGKWKEVSGWSDKMTIHEGNVNLVSGYDGKRYDYMLFYKGGYWWYGYLHLVDNGTGEMVEVLSDEIISVTPYEDGQIYKDLDTQYYVKYDTEQVD